jgi:WD40 repeat protein
MFIKSAVMMFLMLGLSLHPSLAAPTTDTAHFTGEFTFFEMDTNDSSVQDLSTTFLPVVSNTGRYVFAHVNTPVGYHIAGHALYERTLYFWDLAQPHPYLSPAPTQALKISQQFLGPWISFSPNDEFVALKSEVELQIRRLPSLEIELSVATNDRIGFSDGYRSQGGVSDLAWSRDGSRLAAIGYRLLTEDYEEDELLIWDRRDEKIQAFFAGTHLDSITTLETAWLIHSTEEDFYQLCPFGVKARLPHCLPMSSPPENYSLFTLPTGITAMVGPVTNNQCPSPSGPVSLLQLQSAGYYGSIAGENISAFTYYGPNGHVGPIGYYESTGLRQMPTPVSFSPDGQYFFYTQGCRRKWGVWDFKNNRMLQSIVPSRWEQPSWLPDSRHFLVYDTYNASLSIRAVGNAVPLDILNLNTLPGLEDLNDWIYSGAHNIWNISGDGRHVMINLGHAGILVEIDYGDAETS